MKRAHLVQFLALTLIISVALLGCKKGSKGLTPIPNRTGQGIGDGSRPGGPERVKPVPGGDGSLTSALPTEDGQTSLGNEPFDRSKFNEDRNQFREQTVYFDFDQSTIRASEHGKIETVASFLKTEPGMKLLIEGHCDERGTPEYNRSLGERRALAVREQLISIGIIGERVQTISYGEDRPADAGHDEAAWAKNRRGEFILMRPK